MLIYKAIRLFSKGHKVLRGYLIPPAPSRPPSAFLIYFGQLNSIPYQPKVPATEAAKLWKSFPPQLKAPYETRYKESLQVYLKTLNSYNSEFIDAFKYEPSGYQLFIKENYQQARKKLISRSSPQVFTALAKRWSELSESEKSKYSKTQEQETSQEKRIKQAKIHRLKDNKIPSIGKTGKATKQEINCHKEQLKLFCAKHSISIEELTKLTDPPKVQIKQKIWKKQKEQNSSLSFDKVEKSKKQVQYSHDQKHEQTNQQRNLSKK